MQITEYFYDILQWNVAEIYSARKYTTKKPKELKCFISISMEYKLEYTLSSELYKQDDTLICGI